MTPWAMVGLAEAWISSPDLSVPVEEARAEAPFEAGGDLVLGLALDEAASTRFSSASELNQDCDGVSCAPRLEIGYSVSWADTAASSP